MAIKAVIFDYDNTLVSTIETKWAQFKKMSRTFYDFDLTDEKIREYWGRPMDDLLEQLFPKLDTLDQLYQNYLSLDSEFPMQLYPGVLEIFSTLKQRKIKYGILTATSRRLITERFDTHNFPVEDFFTIQCADDSKYHKPDPRVFDNLLAKLKSISINANETVYIGDDIRDYQAANAAGMKFIGIPNGLTSETDLKNTNSPVIKTLPELLELI